MFFREKKTSSEPILQLVQNYRNQQGTVSQRVVVSLADCHVPDEFRRAVASEVAHRAVGYQCLPDLDSPASYWTQRVLDKMKSEGKLSPASHHEVKDVGRKRFEMICAEDVEHEDGTELGPLLVLLQAWKSLELDAVLQDCEFSPQQIATAKVSVLNRLIDPCSENELPNWVKTTALGDLLRLPVDSWGEDRFYRISDRLLVCRPLLEEHLRERERNLFNLDRTILLYDLTNSYFEGIAAQNELAQRSMASKEKRTDCPLISVGVVLDAEGFVITHRVFAGNISDCKTLLNSVTELERLAEGDSKPVIIVDGGMASEDNLEQLRANGYDYIVNGKRQKRALFADDFLEREKFRRVEGREGNVSKQPVYVRRIRLEGETVVLCRSEGRQDKEDAIQDSAERKLIDELEHNTGSSHIQGRSATETEPGRYRRQSHHLQTGVPHNARVKALQYQL